MSNDQISEAAPDAGAMTAAQGRRTAGSVPSNYRRSSRGILLDASITIVLAAGLTAVFTSLPQSVLFGDVYVMIGKLTSSNLSHHYAHFPLANVAGLWTGPDEAARLLGASALGGGLTGAFGYLLGRLVSLARTPAVLLGLVAAATPVVSFFATLVEVHAIQAAAVVLAYVVALIAAHRQGVVVKSVLIALATFVAFSGHPVQLLALPGLIAAARPSAVVTKLLVIASIAGAVLTYVGIGLVLPRLDLQGLIDDVPGPKTAIESLISHAGWILDNPMRYGAYRASDIIEHWRYEWIERQALLPLLGVLACVFTPVKKRAATLMLLACSPTLVVVPLLGVREMGGYFIALIPPALIVIGWALRERSRWTAGIVLSVLLAAQLFEGQRLRDDYSRMGLDEALVADARRVRAEFSDPALPAPTRVFILTLSGARNMLMVNSVGIGTVNLRFVFDALPRHAFRGFLEAIVAQIEQGFAAGTTVLIDVALLDPEIPGSEKVSDAIAELLEVYTTVEVSDLERVRQVVRRTR